jgi:hypothetical protein
MLSKNGRNNCRQREFIIDVGQGVDDRGKDVVIGMIEI